LTEQELQTEIRRLADAAEQLSRSSATGTNAMKGFSDSLNSSAEKMYDKQTALDKLSSGAIEFGAAVYKSDRTLTKYTGSVDRLTDGIAGLASNIPIFGGVIGGLIKVVGKLTSSTLKYDQAYLDSYDQLSQFGFAGTDVADSLHQLTEGTGYTRDAVAKLTKITTGLGDNLVGLGKTAGEGAKSFFKIAEVGAETRDEFRRLGMSQEDLTKHQAEYIKMQGKLGNLQNKSTDTLKDESLKYTKSLVKLSALTGKSVDQVENSMKERMNDYAFNSYIKEVESKQGVDAARRIQEGVEKVGGTFGESSAKGLMEILSTGTAQSQEAIALVTSSGGDIMKWSKQFKDGKITMEELQQKMATANEGTEKMLGAAARQNTELAGQFNISVQSMAGSAKTRNEQVEGLVEKQIAEATVPKEGDLKDTQGKAVETQIALGTAYDTLTELLSGPVNSAFRGLLKGLDLLTEGFTRVLTMLGAFSPEVPYMFKDMSQLKELETTKKAKLAELESTKIKIPDNIPPGLADEYGRDANTHLQNDIRALKLELEGIKTQMNNLEKPNNVGPKVSSTSSSSSEASNTKNSGVGDGDISKIKGMMQPGVFSGPDSGFMSAMSGNEAVVPLPDGTSIPVSFKNMPSQLLQKQNNPLTDDSGIADIIKGYMSSLTKDTTNVLNQISVNQENSSGLSDDLVAMVSDKLDTLLQNMKTNNDLQDDLLQYMKR
jgi:hypothetical protein